MPSCHWPSILIGLTSFALASLLPVTGVAGEDDPASVADSFRPSPDLGLAELQSIVMEANPELEVAHLQVDLARAQVRQSRLRQNPTLELAWGTIPVGTTNPPDLERPFANVPNYGVGIGFPIRIGKRGPRIRQARALERGAKAELEAVARDQAFELAEILGELAAASLRREGFEQIVADTERSIAAAEQRIALSYGVPLELDQLGIELARVELQVQLAGSDVSRALAACALLVGRTCEEFTNSDEARAYLEAWIAGSPADETALEQRPDLRALDEYGKAAESGQKLARAQRIPDPTIRLGYLHDRFLVSGNHMNSFSISLSVPLPVFDRGQAQSQAAQAQARRLANERSKRIAAANVQIPALERRVELERERQAKLRDEAIPAAKAIVSSLEAAADKRLTSITEIIQARRAVRELLLEEADAYSDAYQARLEYLRVLAAAPELDP